MSKENILEVKNLSVLIKERFLVKNATFSMKQGECFGIVGEDRSGKTSLIKALSGSLPITSGNVLIDGKNIVEDKDILTAVNICFDPPIFFKFQTVYDNIKFLSSLSDDCTKEQIITVLNKFNLAHKIKTRVLFLTYYEKKLMALALAFLTEPKLLLLDEPFKGLPDDSIEEIKKHIKEIQAKGTSIIISSINVENMEDLCDKYIFMEARLIKNILTNKECQRFDFNKTYAFVEVKYPHYTGKLLIDNFGLKVKLLHKKVLFEANEDTVSEIVKYITSEQIEIYKAGYLSKKSEIIFAELAPYFKEEEK